jgi:SAM-dependent methyltransferase
MDPVLVDGIPCYAPAMAVVNDGFPPERFSRLYQAECRNFWYRSRARIIKRLVLARLSGEAEFLEIGCGTGSVLEFISQGTHLHLAGGEAYLEGLKLAKARLPQAEFIQLDARELPFKDRFDGIGLFDVLEHLDDDELVLRNTFKALKPGGFIFATAPQHPFLWSANDDVAYHRRRYARGELGDKLRRAGFDVDVETSFVTALFPVMAITRYLKHRPPEGDPYEAVLRELELPPTLNSILEAIMRVDEALISCGLSLPFGGSIVLVGRRPGEIQ